MTCLLPICLQQPFEHGLFHTSAGCIQSLHVLQLYKHASMHVGAGVQGSLHDRSGNSEADVCCV
jgi:hypothetical protein